LGHYLLTVLLLPVLTKTENSRVVNLSSLAHTMVTGNKGIDFDNLMWEKDYTGTAAYARSKLANIYFTKKLAGLIVIGKNAMKVVSLHPGIINTALGRYAGKDFY